MHADQRRHLSNILNPQNLAIIGASDHIHKFGGEYLRAQKTYGFKGRIFPVHPQADTIQGLKAYPGIAGIPVPVDLAVITVPAEAVLEQVKACATAGVKGVQILSAGFRELGPQGAALEEAILHCAQTAGMRVIGPNCFGVHSPRSGLTLMPGIDFPPESGTVGLISQSGVGACDVVYAGMGKGVRFSAAVSIGNGGDVDTATLLDYFSEDPDTQVVGAYIEGVRDGRSFLRALRHCATRKPVIILKGGLSAEGHRGTRGHTGSLSGTRENWTAALRTAGAIEAKDLDDLTDCLMACVCLPNFSGTRVGIMAGGGVRVVEGLDAAVNHGFTVPELCPASGAKIRALLPPVGARTANPVDLANPGIFPQLINPVLDALSTQADIDFTVMYQMYFYVVNWKRRRRMAGDRDFPETDHHRAVADHALEIRRHTGKPLVLILPEIVSHPDHFEMALDRLRARTHYTARGIPCFDNASRAFDILRRLRDHERHRQRTAVV